MKKIFKLAVVLSGMVTTVSCNQTRHVHFAILKDRVIEMSTYNTIDYDYAQKWFKANPFHMGGCSAIVKDVAKSVNDVVPHLIVGRNMDYGFSKSCAYIIRTEEKDAYKTLGTAYATCKASPSFEEVKKKGISDEWYKMAPFFCTDIINEKGLYCEINMRNVERDKDGKSIFRCSGTNPGKPDVYMLAVARYLVAHCKDVKEAESYAKTKINVFNKEDDWNFSFLLGDADGKYGLLEFGHNVVTFEERNCHTNYFLNAPFGPKSDTEDGESKNHFGIGRYNYLTDSEHIDAVHDCISMYNLMNDVSYSNVYKGLKYCPFDMKSEAYGTVAIDGKYDYSFEDFMSDKWKDKVEKAINEKMKELAEMPQAEREKLPWYWQSTFTNVIDIPSRTIYSRMFEKPDYTFTFTL